MTDYLRSLLKIREEIPPQEFPHPIFISGCMRSGTTFLLNLLHEHPDLLKVGVELNNIWTSIGGAPCGFNGLGPTSYRNADDVRPIYQHNMTHYFSRYIREAKTWRQHAIRAKYRYTYKTGGIFKNWDQLQLLNKSVHFVNKILYLHAMYPQSKFIFIVRDIYGQAASQKMHFEHEYNTNKRVPFLPKEERAYWTRKPEAQLTDEELQRSAIHHFNYIPQAWLQMNKLALAELSTLAEQQYMVINFETFVERKKETLEQIFEFLNVSLTPLSKIATKKRKLMNSRSPGDPLDKWKQILNNKEQAIIKSIINEYTDDYNTIYNQIDS